MAVAIIIYSGTTMEVLEQIPLVSQQKLVWKVKESIRGQTQNSNSGGGGRRGNCCHIVIPFLSSHLLENLFFFWWDKKGQKSLGQEKQKKEDKKACSLLYFLYDACHPSTDNTSLCFFPFTFHTFLSLVLLSPEQDHTLSRKINQPMRCYNGFTGFV